jgi:DNA-directed RNA polymerase specialized sigma24 family protein
MAARSRHIDFTEVDSRVECVWRSAFAAAWRLQGDPDQAEEIAQTAVERFLLDPGRVRSAAGWAAALARNAVREGHRRKLRSERLCAEVPVDRVDSEDGIVRGLTLRSIIARARSDDRILLEGALQGESHRTLSQSTGLPTSAIGAYLHRAVQRLRSQLAR